MKITSMLALLVFAASIASANPTVVVEEVTEASELAPAVVNGVVRSRRDVALPARAEGQLEWVLEEGSEIVAGDVVARIDDVQLKLQLNEEELLRARAQVNLDYLQGEVERLRALEQENMAAKTQLAELKSRRDFAMNDVSVSESRIARLKDTISRTRIVAPVDGVIVERLKQGGEYARTGDSVVRLINTHSLEIKAAVPVSYLGRLVRDRLVQVRVGNVELEAKLRTVIRSSNSDSQTFDVIVDLPEASSELFLNGQFATVSLPIASHQALYVPRDAVILRSDGSYVFRIGDDNVAERVEVTLGDGYGNLVSVLGELKVGDRVAIRGVERLQNGQAVEPVS